MSRTPLTLLAVVAALALTACGASPEPSSAPVTSAAISAVPSPSTSSSATDEPVDNEALGEALANTDTTALAILAGVWKDTPKAKRVGTCQRWENTPEDVFGVPLFAKMDRETVSAFFDDACGAY